MDTVEPVKNDLDVTEDHFKQSIKALDYLAISFKTLGTKLANRKKAANLRILEAILFETHESEKTFGKEEKNMLDICRSIMYHRQIVEIFLMKQESKKTLEEYTNE